MCAEITGISKNTLYAITKRDSVNVRVKTVEKISKALEIPVATLLGCDKNGEMSDIDKLAYEKMKKEDIPIKVDNTTVTFDKVMKSISKSIADSIVIDTIAAHHDNENWTEEELREIEEFKKFVLSKRKTKED